MKNYNKRKIFADLQALFFDTSGRPKKTPLYESSIRRRLEKKYLPSEINYALKKLQSGDLPERKRIVCKKIKLRKNGKRKLKKSVQIKFFYPESIERNENQKIRTERKISKFVRLIQKYSDINNITMLGKYLHYLVKTELRAQGFEIIDENTRTFGKKHWTETKHTLDIIARHTTKELVIGVEIKNRLDVISQNQVKIKLKMCKYLEIIPIFACRWLKPYHKLIDANDGYGWEFKKQLYPLGQEKMVQILRSKFELPVEVALELPNDSIEGFRTWIQKF